MARNPGVKTRPGRNVPTRPTPKAAGAGAVTLPTAAPAPPKKKTSPAQFMTEVRQETRKITWPSWKETWITSVMVFLMVALTAVFFLLTDGALSFLTQQFLKLAG